MAKKEKEDTNHKMGKHTGYYQFEDGSIGIAPRYIDEYKALAAEEQAISDLLAHVMQHCARMQTKVNAQSSRLWDELGEDIGLNYRDFEYSVDMRVGKLMRRAKPKSEDSSQGKEGEQP